jgi:aconitate hydratase
MSTSLNSFNCRKTLNVGDKTYIYFSLKAAEQNGLSGIFALPYTHKVLLENLLRNEDGRSVTKQDIQAIADWLKQGKSSAEIAFRPARVLMQDFTGVPAVVDLAAMRDGIKALGDDPKKINPLAPVDLVIDHSVMVDNFGNKEAFALNVAREYERNGERYEFLKWGQGAFDNFRAVPPGTGICHQVNLEYLARTVWTKNVDGEEFAYPDTVVGTDSHTTMINGLAVLGWGVGGIEAEAAMLGQPISMLIPEVIGFRLTGKLSEGVTATDLVLRVVQMLREKGVVGKFVEFCGQGLDNLALEDQATLANMAPEYGATCGFFPVSNETLQFLHNTGRDEAQVALVKEYAHAQGMFRAKGSAEPTFTSIIELDMASVRPAISGPKRPQDRILLDEADTKFAETVKNEFKVNDAPDKRFPVADKDHDLGHGDVMVAAITSCTNTSNPSVMIAAGLVARNANKLGLTVKPWVKTSLAPGSQVVTEYLEKAGLQDELNKIGFDLVGYGCTTCIGNTGPLAPEYVDAINDNNIVSCSVLSGNRNFEGRISPNVRANYLASPPLVVAYAIAGNLNINVAKDSLGKDRDGNDVYLKDIWPSSKEVADTVAMAVTRDEFIKRYADVFAGDPQWQKIKVENSLTYGWSEKSTYIQNPPYFDGMTLEVEPINNIENARILGLFGDSITTDHISPAGAIKGESPAGHYLRDFQVRPADFNSYGSRRGNHQVMMRGTFANIRIKNLLAPGTEGGVATHFPSGKVMDIYDAAMQYKDEGVELIVFGGKEYGTGSSRDWAAKGTKLLGVRAVIVESFERIHRSNLIGMGVLPLQFKDGDSWKKLGLKGDETVTIEGLEGKMEPGQTFTASITSADGKTQSIDLLSRIDTLDELDYYTNGGILSYVLRNLANS